MDYYKTHQVANMGLPSISIVGEDHVPIDDDRANWDSDLLTNHAITLSIRVHTGYEGGPTDIQSSTLYLDQIVESLKKNIEIPGNYRLMSFEITEFNTVFSESATTGGEIEIELHTLKNYIQS